MRTSRIARCVVGGMMTAALMACSTSVKREDVNTVQDLSGRWNDTDSRLVAEEMIQDCLSQGWLPNYHASQGANNPSVIVGAVHNKSLEHINTDTFIEDLQRSLINSGKVNFVASQEERGDVRAERLDQDTNASDATRKAAGQETGADFMLSGVLNAIEDKEGGKEIMFYQVDLKLLNMSTNQIAWVGQKKIKKYITQSGLGL